MAQTSDEQLLELLQATVYPDASATAVKQALRYCQALELEPLRKPVHIILLWDPRTGEPREALLPGIGLYRSIAARSGWAGMDEPEFGPDITEVIGGRQITYPQWCRVSVRRRLATGETASFTAKEFWKENVALSDATLDGPGSCGPAPNEMWSRRPYGQLAKCTEAQALRKAFPEIGSQPLLEELEGKLHSRAPAIQRVRPPARSPADGSQVPHRGEQDAGAIPSSEPGAQAPSPPTERQRVAIPRARRVELESTGESRLDAPSQRARPRAAADQAMRPPLASRQRRPTEHAAQLRETALDPEQSMESAAPPASEPAPAPAPVFASAAPAQACFEPLSAGEMAYLMKRLAARRMTVAQARAAAGLTPGDHLEDVARSDFAALKGAVV